MPSFSVTSVGETLAQSAPPDQLWRMTSALSVPPLNWTSKYPSFSITELSKLPPSLVVESVIAWPQPDVFAEPVKITVSFLSLTSPVAGITSVFITLPQVVHSICFEPFSVAVAALSIIHALSLWPVAGIVSVYFSPHEQVYTFSPSASQVAAFVDVRV